MKQQEIKKSGRMKYRYFKRETPVIFIKNILDLLLQAFINFF